MDKDIINYLPRAAQEVYLVKEKILAGEYGAPGAPFMTTRTLAQARGVSIVTAQNIMVGLREKRLIELRGKKYFLSHKRQMQEMRAHKNVIGMLVPNISNEFHAAMVKVMKILAGKRDYSVVVMDFAYLREQERAAIDLFWHFGVAGIISCPGVTPPNPGAYEAYPLPCVFLGRTLEDSRRSSVQVNSLPVTQRIARHLVEQGYRKFIYLGSKMVRLVDDDRYIGFRSGLEREGFALEEGNVFRMPQSYKAADIIINELLAKITEPVGIFCYHDLIAVEVNRICHLLGINIPGQVGLVGFDDLPIASNIIPSLTTVQYRNASMAEIALQLLLQEIEGGKGAHDNFYVEPILMVRGSTMRTGTRYDDTSDKQMYISAI